MEEKKIITILGDLHLTSRKNYLLKACEEFLFWFKSWDKNNENNTLILAGDLVDSHVNGGIVISLLERLYTSSKFKEIHICVGNHDKKKVDGFNQIAYDFFKEKNNVFIYEYPQDINIENKKVLILPYFTDHYKDKLMNEYYSNLYKEYKGPYDLVVGHFSGEDASFAGATDCIRNLDKINTKKICLGHIHTRITDPNKYIGSVYAGRKNENDSTRAAWYLDGDNWKEDKLPIFTEYLVVTYPDPLPKSKALVPIYTILNCANESIAKKEYGDIYIRRVTIEKTDSTFNGGELDFEFSSLKNINAKELFREFIDNHNPPLSEEVKRECEAIFKVS